MPDVIQIANRNGPIDVEVNPAAARVHVEGVFDILGGENQLRVRFFDIVSADARTVRGVETLVLSLTREAAQELAGLLTQAAGPPAHKRPAAAPPPPEPPPRHKIKEI